MKHIGMMKALRLCKTYEKMTTEQRTVLQQERFRSLVIYARENSPYYARLYGGLPKDYLLSELPPVSKRELMDHWDEWVTDRSVTLSQIQDFMQNPDNIGRRWQRKYMEIGRASCRERVLVFV